MYHMLPVPESESGVSSVDMKLHARNPRILLTILHPDAVNRLVAPGYHGRSHVIISLLQVNCVVISMFFVDDYMII